MTNSTAYSLPGRMIPKSNFNHVLFRVIKDSYNLEYTALIERTRKRHVVLIRQAAMYMLRKHKHTTFEDIGRLMKLNHCTVLYSCNQCDESVKHGYDQQLKEVVNTLEFQLRLNGAI